MVTDGEHVVVEGIPCIRRRYKPAVKKGSESFLAVPWGALSAVLSAIPRMDRTTAVFLCVVNACRTAKTREIRFTPRWYKELGLSPRAVCRGLERLEKAGFLTVVKRRGCSPTITLLSHVPITWGRKK